MESRLFPEEPISAQPREDACEITRKRFEKNLLKSFQLGISRLQEKKLEEGISMLHELLAIDELSSDKLDNPDYEKLRAAVHLNLYKAFAELGHHRKSFHFMVKFLDYQKDNYQMAYEFGSKLLDQGFVGGALVYLKRAMSFGIARKELEFARVVLEKLTMAICTTEDHKHLKEVLDRVGSCKLFRHVNLEDSYRRYYALLEVLQSQQFTKSTFESELSEMPEGLSSGLEVEVERIKRVRKAVGAKREQLRLESLRLASSDQPCQSVTHPPDQLNNMLLTQKQLNLNGLVAVFLRQVERYERVLRQEVSGESGRDSRTDSQQTSRMFFTGAFRDVLTFEVDRKGIREPSAVDGRPKLNFLQWLEKNNYNLDKSDEVLSYLLTLLKETGTDTSYFEASHNFDESQMVVNGSARKASQERSRFYQEVVEGCHRLTFLGSVQMFLGLVFGEQCRSFRTHTGVFRFFGPSLFLREDFGLAWKEFLGLLTFLEQHFNSFVDFGALLVFLECLFNFDSRRDLRGCSTAVQRLVALLRSKMDQLRRKDYERYTLDYLSFLREIGFQDSLFSQLGGHSLHRKCRITTCPNRVPVGRKEVFCDKCISALNSPDAASTAVFVQLSRQTKHSLCERVAAVCAGAKSDDLVMQSMANADSDDSEWLVRSDMLQSDFYWLRQRTVQIDRTNYAVLFDQLLPHFNLNGIDFVCSLCKIDFSGVSVVADSLAQVSIVTSFINRLFRFLEHHSFQDSKGWESFLESSLQFFQVSDILKHLKAVLSAETDTATLEAIHSDKDFSREVTRLTLLLFLSCGGAQLGPSKSISGCVKQLVLMGLKLSLRTSHTEHHFLSFAFFLFLNDSTQSKHVVTDYLFSPNKRIDFLKSALVILQRYLSRGPAELPNWEVPRLHMFTAETFRVVEAVYGMKLPQRLRKHVIDRVLGTGDREEEGVSFNNKAIYTPADIKVKPVVARLAEEGRGQGQGVPASRLLLESFLLFRLFWMGSGYQGNETEFLFCKREEECRFGESKPFADKNIKVLSVDDLRVRKDDLSRLAVVFRQIERLPNLFAAFEEGLAKGEFGSGLVGGDRPGQPVCFRGNEELFLFLLVSLRYLESWQVDPSGRLPEDPKPASFAWMFSFYKCLHLNDPFGHFELTSFFKEAVSRTRLLADMTTDSYFQLGTDSADSELPEENSVIEALTNLGKIRADSGALRAAVEGFPSHFRTDRLAELASKEQHCVDYLLSRCQLMTGDTSKRVDYLLMLYFPDFLVGLPGWHEWVFVDKFRRFNASISRPSHERYHQNLRSNFDSKATEKSILLKVVAFVRLLTGFYTVHFKEGLGSVEDMEAHVKDVEEDLRNRVESQRVSSHNANELLTAIDGVPPSKGSSDGTKQKPTDKQAGSTKRRTKKDQSKKSKVEDKQAESGMVIEQPVHGQSRTFRMLNQVYAELISCFDRTPKSFADFWASVWAVVFENSLKDRKSHSGLVFQAMTESFFVVQTTFGRWLADSPTPAFIADSLAKVDMACREKDFKLFYVESALTRKQYFVGRLLRLARADRDRAVLVGWLVRTFRKNEDKRDETTQAGVLAVVLQFMCGCDIMEAKVELAKTVWDLRSENFKALSGSPSCEAMMRALVCESVRVMARAVQGKLGTEEEKRDLVELEEHLRGCDKERFDWENDLKNFKGARGVLKRLFEDKPTGATGPKNQTPE